MSESELVDLVNLILGPVYLILIGLVALRQLDRVMRHRIFRKETPSLLLRDLFLFWSLVVLTLIPLVAIIFGNREFASGIVWVLIRAAIGLFVLGLFAYFEFFVIGRSGHEVIVKDSHVDTEMKGEDL